MGKELVAVSVFSRRTLGIGVVVKTGTNASVSMLSSVRTPVNLGFVVVNGAPNGLVKWSSL